MSPFQQDVIGATLSEFDLQAQRGLTSIADQALAAGAFGGGREGVQRAEYQAASDRNRAALQAQLLQQGFGQAQQAAGQAFGQQQLLSQQQQALAGLSPNLVGQQVAGLQTLGGGLQAQRQAELKCTTTTSSTTIITTINCGTDFRIRHHGSNLRIPWRNTSNTTTCTKCFTISIRFRCNTCRYL